MNPCKRLSPCHGIRCIAGGFTLIEIMVVMLLLSIVLAVAIPRFDSGILQDPQKVVTRRLIQTIRTLRTNAVADQRTFVLMMDADRNRYWIVDDTMDELARAQAAEQAGPLPGNVRLSGVVFPDRDAIQSGPAEIRFYAAGYSDQALIHLLTDQDHRWTIRIEPLLPKITAVNNWLYYE